MILLWMGCAVFAAVCGLTLFLALVAEGNMKQSLHQQLHEHTAYVRYMRDKHDLNGLGFPQQLTRHMGGLSSFGLSFSSLPLIGGAVFLLGPAIASGGPAVIGFGWPVLGLFGLLTACSVAAFASAVPTAGGCYHWALASGGRRSGLWSGWLHLLGSGAMLATMNLWLADWMCRNVERHLGYTGGTGLFYIVLVMLFVTQAAVNARAFRSLGRLHFWTAGCQLLLFVAILAILAAVAWPGEYPFQILTYTAMEWNPLQGAAGSDASWLLGLMLLQRMFLGIGEGAQSGEETRDPRITVPWSIYLSAAALAIFGFILFAFIAVHAKTGAEGLTALPGIGDWLVDIWDKWGAACSVLFFVLAALLAWANGTSTMASASRTLFAMARDESVPAAGKLAAVSEQYRSPVVALLTVTIVTGGIALLLAIAASPASLQTLIVQLILVSIAAMHAAYATPLGGKLKEAYSTARGSGGQPRSRRRNKLNGPWALGKYGTGVDTVTVCWLGGSALLAVVLLNPVALTAAAACLLVIAVVVERTQRSLRRKTPVKIVGSMRFSRRTIDECIRIERKFPQ